MPESDSFWDFYWEVRLRGMEDLGKSQAILAVSELIREKERAGQPVRLLELGCGEGQIIGQLIQAHAQVRSIGCSLGVDYSQKAIETCRRAFPGISFLEGDFTDPDLVSGLGQYEIVLLVNALHEVFSACYSPDLGQVDVQKGKRRVEEALAGAVGRLTPAGTLVLFDGLEPSGNPRQTLRVRFLGLQARQRFEQFARQYLPFPVTYQQAGEPLQVELSLRDFTRYVTKMIFLGSQSWERERLESYQYFTEEEFEGVIERVGLEIRKQRILSVNYERWRNEVEIVTPGIDFPSEHILTLAQKPA